MERNVAALWNESSQGVRAVARAIAELQQQGPAPGGESIARHLGTRYNSKLHGFMAELTKRLQHDPMYEKRRSGGRNRYRFADDACAAILEWPAVPYPAP